MPIALDMDDATWAEINRLLDHALDLRQGEREAWLQSLGAAEQPLLPRLRQLLQSAGPIEARDFLGTLPRIGSDESDSAGAHAKAGQANDPIGPYRLIRELGSGGMGAVWLAERTDGILNRPVALKLPHATTQRANLAERMAREREILASLTHPHIARLYDAGITDKGQPYLALEFVEGERIDTYCRSHELGVGEKLRLFQQIAAAVAYAHSKLVVHRDLKPANVLVTEGAEVRLLDFGIAKLLDEGRTQNTALTEFAGAAFTPDYASPEQIRGEPLSIESDVYSLGVILYELLSGAPPYRLKRDSRGALEDAILTVEPPRPSERAPAAIRSALRGDLDTIVIKALKKAAPERYATVNAFSDDVSRYLEGRPVLARPDSSWYRIRKFAARNRLVVFAAAAIVLAVAGGAVVSAWQARVAIREKDHAQEVERFITSIFSDANPYASAGRTMTAVELLHTARDEIDQQFSRRPDLRVDLLAIVGSSLGNLSDYAAAESALRTALLESQRLYGPTHIETLRIRALLTDVYSLQRNKVALRAELASLLPLARAQATVDAEPLVRALKNMGSLAFEEGRLDEVVGPAREAFEIGRRRLGARNALTVEASTLVAEGTVMTYNMATEDMLKQTAESLQIALAAYGQNSDHAQVVRSREVRARSLGVAGYYRDAIVEQRAAIASATRTLGPTDRIFVDMKNSLGSWERRVGEVKESLVHSSESLAILREHGETHTADYATVLMSHGNNLLTARRPMAAQAALAQAEAVCLELYGSTHWDSLTAHFNRALALAYGGRSQEAIESLTLLENPSNDIKLPWWIDYVRGTVYRLAGQSQVAIDALTRANSEIAKNPREPWDRVRVLQELGQAQLDLGQFAAADETLAADEKLFEQLKVEMHPAYADVVLARARIDLARNAPAQSLPRLERVDAYWQAYDPNSRGGGEPARWLAAAYVSLGRDADAAVASARAKRLLSLQWQ